MDIPYCLLGNEIFNFIQDRISMKNILIFLILLASYFLVLDNVSASPKVPGNMNPIQVPQFVSIGFDDNYYEDGMI